MLKTLTVVLAFIILALVVAAAGLMPARAQGLPAKPSGVSVAAGARADEVTVSWQAADDATLYRIGWVAFDKIVAVRNANRHWLDAFAFTDVSNYGQSAHPLDGLLPGVQYAFIVGSVNSRFGTAAWSDWVYLTTAEAATQCPAGAGNPPEPQAPDPTPTPTPDPNATPTPTPEPGATPTATPQPDAAVTPTPTPVAVGVDYDRDDNGLIEINSLAQLDAVRHDLDGDGVSAHTGGYAEAFPDAASGMGCFRKQCQGYELVANLDFDTNGNGQIDEGDAWWDDGNGWYPIGEVKYPFNTVLDGNGHTIANLYIDWTDTTHIGLFRRTGRDAVIRNLTLTQAYVAGGAEKVGALAGWNGGQIANSHISGEVTGGSEVGGLAGRSSGTISGSHSSVSVSGNAIVGGLVGRNDGTITNSYATGSINGKLRSVGGLIGVSTGDITNSYATGNVTGEGHYAGGLMGANTGSITKSYATGDVSSEGYYIGGLIGGSGGSRTLDFATTGASGRRYGSQDGTVIASHATGNVTGEGNSVGGLIGHSNSTVIASYATGNVTGDERVGGLIGKAWDSAASFRRNHSTISSSYATGNVTGNGRVGGLVGSGGNITDSYAAGQITAGDRYVGGLTWNGSLVTRSYWDTQTTGQSQGSRDALYYGVGKTTREMQRPTGPTGIYADWDPEYWDFGTSRQYPVLKYEGMDVGAQRR